MARMTMRYGHAWASQYGADDTDAGNKALQLVLAEWAEALAGLTDAELRTGFRRDLRRGDHWPPSAPEFAALCRGVPSLAMVKHQLATFGPSRSKFCRLVWSVLDTFAFTRADSRYADRLLADAYELAKTHVMSGGPLPDEPSGLIEAKPTPRTPAKPETAEKHLREMAEALGAEQEDEDDADAE